MSDGPPASDGPCPGPMEGSDPWYFYGPLPTCDVSSQGRICPLFEASEKCLEGQWYICGKTISRWCRADAAPEGARCCEWDFIEDYRGGRDTCCIGGYVAACKDDHVIHLGTCELPNANDPWAFHGIPDAAPATADGGAVDAMRSSQDSGTDD